jgi:soluble lytic murein transglycosylase
VAAVISVESMFKADAKSHVGAMGLMQLMPETAKDIAKSSDIKLNDPRTNISYGIDYLKWLEKRYSGIRTYMLAAYNWGPGNVDKVINGKSRTPADVSNYASTIITRATHWKRHYETANVETNIIGAKLSKTQ